MRAESGASHADTAVPFQTGPSASARCATTTGAICGCPGGMWRVSSATLSRKNRFFMHIPAAWRTASGCSGAICIAATARTGSPRKRFAIRPLARSPRELVDEAVSLGARLLVSTYNEPLITAEWGVAVFRKARAAGLATGFVSNGNATPEVLEYLRPWLDLYKVDLKGFHDRHYRELGGRLQPILDTIQQIYAAGIWLEIVTLLIPGFNDDPAEVRDLTRFIAGVSPEIPWHVTAFHRDYNMTDTAETTPDMLRRAAAIGRKAGLQFVYAGNRPAQVGNLEHTACPHCGIRLIEREGYGVIRYALTEKGRCSGCGALVPGRWDTLVDRQSATRPIQPRSRRLRVIP